MRITLSCIVFLLCSSQLYAQIPSLSFENSVRVKGLENAWVGGLNASQFSYGDLSSNRSFLFVYDRTNAKAVLFEVLKNSDGSKLLKAAPEEEQKLPSISHWALVADYNQDGLGDIFSWGQNGIVVDVNVSASALSFERIHAGLTYKENGKSFPLFVNPKDYPAIKDIDADGDLDILCFNYPDGDKVEFYQNMSFEQTGKANQLIFEKKSKHWGGFSEISCIEYGFIPKTGRLSHDTHKTAHIGGGAILPIDINGDSFLDVMIGKEGCNHVNVLINDEVESGAYWFSKLDTLFPKPIQASMHIFPVIFDVPLGVNDTSILIMSPNIETNAGYLSDFEHSVWLFKNQNSIGTTDFQLRDSSFLQNDMIDVGEQSVPAFVDFDLDGDQDLVLGNKGSFSDKFHAGRLVLYENIGSQDTAYYQKRSDDWLGISTKGWFNLRPQFADIDYDGIPDFILSNTFNYQIGDSDVKWAKGSIQNASLHFSETFNSLTIGYNIMDAPTFFDMDQDGDLDVLIGKSNGALEYWNNNGYPSVDFARVSASAMGIIGNTGLQFLRVLPYLNKSGQVEVLAFSNQHSMVYLGIWNEDRIANLDVTNLLFLEQTNEFVSPNLGLYLSPAQVNSSSGANIVIGSETGGLMFLKVKEGQRISTEKLFVIWPNPAKESVNVQVKQDGVLTCYDLSGKTVFQTVISANFTKNLPLNGLAKGCYFIKFASETETHVEKLLVD